MLIFLNYLISVTIYMDVERLVALLVYSFARSHSFLLSFLFITKEYPDSCKGEGGAEVLKKENMEQDRAR